jgi:threonine/homoserine/homoserine lactone efflux protein
VWFNNITEANMITFDGIKFGFLMQLSVGPVALMVLNISIQSGYINGLTFMVGTIIVNIFYTFLACIGISTLLQKNHLQTTMQIVGGAFLLFYGINNIISIFNVSILPKLNLQKEAFTNLFLQGIIITISNPVTIIMIGGILASRIIEKKYSQENIFIFASGYLIARLCFLLILIIIGNIIHTFLQEWVLKILNTIVGIIIVYFGIKLLIKIRT